MKPPHSLTGFDEVIREIRSRAPAGAELVFVSGNFNILHPGHLRLLRFARECGDFLIAGVQDDAVAGAAAVLPEALRLEGLRSNSWVDFAFIMRGLAEEFVAALQPAVVVKGKEHESSDNPEQAVVQSYGGRLLFGSGETVFSSVDLLRQEMLVASGSRMAVPEDFAARHGFSRADLRALIKGFAGLRAIVVGDLIVDEYVECEPLGMSQEDPTIVVTPILQQSFVGGAGIVAAHAAGLGAHVDFFSVAGRDEARVTAEARLRDYGVSLHLLADESRPTTVKRRFRAQHKTLLRVSHLRQHGLDNDLQREVLDRLRPLMQQAHVLAFSDFNYGCLPQTLVDAIVDMARGAGVLMVADSQCSSQIGDVSRFRGMDLLTPTEREARVSIHNHEDGLVVLAEKLRSAAKARNILLKLGAEGVLIYRDAAGAGGWHTDQLPAFSPTVLDTAGAGDSLFAASALALARGGSIWQAAFVGSIASACQVQRVGNIPLRAEELLAALNADK